MAFCKPLQCATLCNTNVRPRKRALQYLETKYQSLSLQEQERIDLDLYGKEEPIIETPDFIELKIVRLREELDRISTKKKNAYSKAMSKSARNTGDGASRIDWQKFYLKFLRAECFDVKKTAKHIILYLKEKLELFGYEILDCKIEQKDLNEQDLATLYGGAFAITGATDNTGRLIAFVRRQQVSCEPVTNLRRVVFYLVDDALEDNEETQKRGFVGISYNISPPGPQKLRHASQVRNLLPFLKTCGYALPLRFAAFHECYNDLSYHFYMGLAVMMLPTHFAPRIVCHYGTTIDCMCELLEYGIDADTLPVTLEGVFKIEMLHNHLQLKRSCEDNNNELAEKM